MNQQQKDFDKFTEFTALLRNWQLKFSAIIQNQGHNPTDVAEIDSWADEAIKEVGVICTRAAAHVRNVATELRNRNYDKEPLGYFQNGRPIYELNPGMMATACILGCSGCRKVIRSMGGPAQGALCTVCYKEGK